MVDPESVARRYSLFSKVVLEVWLDIAGDRSRSRDNTLSLSHVKIWFEVDVMKGHLTLWRG